MKLIALAVFVISLYYGYSIISYVGVYKAVLSWAPVCILVLLMIMFSSCTCLVQGKPNFINTCCTMFLGFIIMILLFLLWNVLMQFFDSKSTCFTIQKNQPYLTTFLDRSMEETYFKGLNALCSDECPCLVKNSTQREIMQKNSSQMNQTLFFADENDGEAAKNVAECPPEIFQKYNFTDQHFQVMAQASQYEMVFNSSGYCYQFDRYLFSDINRGIPQLNIFNIQRFLLKMESQIYMTSIILVFGLLGLNNCMLCCLSWNTAKENKLKVHSHKHGKGKGNCDSQNKKKVSKDNAEGEDKDDEYVSEDPQIEEAKKFLKQSKQSQKNQSKNSENKKKKTDDNKLKKE